MEMPGRTWQGTAEDFRFAFNGKEKANEISSGGYDFDARILDSRIGRWLTRDPHSATYPGLNAYNFAYNNPLIFATIRGNHVPRHKLPLF